MLNKRVHSVFMMKITELV